LLFVHARDRAGEDDRRFLERVHGNPAIGADDLDRVRRIVRDTGALARSEEMARAMVARGKAHIPAITSEPRWQRVLAGVGDYLIERRY
jgi:geranylgeranyl pyrophosphate synthase